MKLGFYTACLPDLSIEQVASFAAEAGFETLEVDVGAHLGDLRAAGKKLQAVRAEGVEVCALTSGGGLLDGDEAAAEKVRARLQATVETAAEHSVGVVAGFAGRNPTVDERANYQELARCLEPVLERAHAGGVKVVFENWPGPRVDWCATTPGGWRQLFALVANPNLGLNLDPSHLVWQGIDHEASLREFGSRVFLSHAKDTEVFAAPLQAGGYFSNGSADAWWTYRLPGRGGIDWRAWIALLNDVGFEGGVTIEHEDGDFGAYGGALERRQEGLREGLRVLRESVG